MNTCPTARRVSVVDDRGTLYTSEPVEIGEHVVWDASFETVALDQLEQRARLELNGVAWKDCGAELREANSHATAVIDRFREATDGCSCTRLGVASDAAGSPRFSSENPMSG